MTDLANAILQAAAAENVNLCSSVIYWTPSNLARHRWSEAPAIRKSSRGPKPFSPQFEPTRPFRPNLVRRGAGSRARNCQARRRSNDCKNWSDKHNHFQLGQIAFPLARYASAAID